MKRDAGRSPNSVEDIAIVGMSCLFPGADSPARFWQNIVGRVDCITDAPPNWQPELFYGPDDPETDRAYTKRGGFLGDLSRFNPAKFGVMPTSIEGAEPDHFIALRCAYETMADAGVPEIPLNRDRTGIIIGRGVFTNRGWVSVFQQLFAVDQVLGVLRRLHPEYDEEQIARIKAELKKNLPPANAETFPGLVHSALVGRIANRMDLNGPAYTVDAACSATLLAVDQGMHELRSRRCDAVLVGGAQVSTPPQIQILFCKLQALSKSGKIAPFSAEACGTMLGQGCGMLLLKRREDAERDGNRIYALLKSIGSSSDGKGAGLLAPRTEGQQLAIRRAYEQAHIDPGTVELLEAHGTGIPMGDATEMNSIRECFSTEENVARMAFGSVKSMIGHLIPAAGAAGLIKTALAIYHRVLPPSLHCEQSAPNLNLAESRFFVCNEPLPWLHGDRDTPRRAGVNAFGFGGINTHAILEEHTAISEVDLPRFEREWPCELVVVSAADRPALERRVAELIAWLDQAAEVRLLDLAATLANEQGPERLSIVAVSVEDLRKKLAHAAKLLADPKRERIQDRKGVFWNAEPLARQGRLAFVFPGEGSQYVGMHAELCRHFPEVRRQLEITDMALKRRGDSTPLADLLYPRPDRQAEAEQGLFRMETALAAVTASARGLLDLLKRMEIQADAVVGHSSGEFAAVLASGAYSPASDEDLVNSIIEGTNSTGEVARSELVPQAVLTSVGGVEPAAVRQAIDSSNGQLVVAMDNCPHQIILVGDEQATAAALTQLEGKGGICQRLPWDRPYHTEAVAPICRFVTEYMAGLPIQSPTIEFWSCATASRFSDEPDAIRDLVVRQWKMPVRFRETVLAMHDAGVRLFVEVGPRGNLSSFVNDTLGDRAHAAIALDTQRKGDIEQLCFALGMLAAHGVEMNLARLFDRRSPAKLDLTSPPPKAALPDPILRLELPTLELSDQFLTEFHSSTQSSSGANGQASAPPSNPISVAPQASPQTASPPRAQPLQNPQVVPPTAPVSARARAMAEFQRTMQTFLQTQEDCMRATARRRVGNYAAPKSIPSLPPQSTPTDLRTSTTSNGSSTRPSPPSEPPAATNGSGQTSGPRSAPKLRYIQSVLEERPGERLVAECEIDVERDIYLKDHTFFGRGLAADPKLIALPIMPMAMTLELMAQAAQRLFANQRVVAISDIQASRWLPFETHTRRVRMVAEAKDESQAQVTVYEADREGMDAQIASATVELAAEFPDLGPPRIADRADLETPWPPADLYGKVLYHGPAFQGIDRVERFGFSGVRAVVHEPDQAKLFADPQAGEPLIPVTLTDTVSQIPGVRNANWGEDGDIVPLAFPNYIERLEFIGDRELNRPLTAITSFDQREGRLMSDVEAFDANGRVVLRYLGKTEEVVDFPLSLYRLADAPTQIRCSRDISALFDSVPELAGCVIVESAVGNEKLFVHRVWAQVLARMVLSRDERQAFGNQKLPPLPAVEWLLGRVAAKDAIRRARGAAWRMADIDVQNDSQGAPFATLPNGEHAAGLSIAHKPFYAVAAFAADAETRLGIDIETLQPLDAGLLEDSFREDERELISRFASESAMSDAIVWRAAWSAKEAIGKALGTGVLGGPRSVRIVELRSGELLAVLEDALASRFPRIEEPIPVAWRQHGEHVIAICALVPSRRAIQEPESVQPA